MISFKNLKIVFILILSSIFLISCVGKFPGADARKYPDDPKQRVQINIDEGRGFRAGNLMDFGKGGSGVFEFASSNELWRASLDIIDFMPLTSVNYSGGIIITDWYSNDQSSNESIKISIRFLTNEIRSDSLDILVRLVKDHDDALRLLQLAEPHPLPVRRVCDMGRREVAAHVLDLFDQEQEELERRAGREGAVDVEHDAAGILFIAPYRIGRIIVHHESLLLIE